MLITSVAHHALHRPDDVAVRHAGRQLSWAEWDERLHRAIGALSAFGIQRGDSVAVIDRNHLAALDMMLAAGALGAMAVLPNWRLGDDELSHILADASPRVVVLGRSFTDRADAVKRSSPAVERIVHLDDEYEQWLASSTPAGPSPHVEPEDIALLMYTSGTTGAAKGVMFSHAGLEANAETAALLQDIREDDHVLASMPLFHIGGATASLAAVRAGLPQTILPDASAAATVTAIENGCTRAFLVPAAISGMLRAGPRERDALASLRLIAYGGSPCPRPILLEALEAMPVTSFLNVYGMTELCGSVTVLTDADHRDPAHRERLSSVGRTIDGVEVRVVDPGPMTDVEAGDSGELWFRTAKSMVGYRGRPDDTAAVIVEDGWVRTGDIGRVDQDGFVYLEDRLKDLIITGGENVFSPEVEAVMESHPDIAEAAAVGIPHPTMTEQVLAVVALNPGAEIDPEDIIAFTRDRLAAFKCPRVVAIVDALPRNESGKVLKRHLRERYSTAEA